MIAVPDKNVLTDLKSDKIEQNYRDLFDHSPIASLLVNRDGLVVDFNRRAADLLLIDPELRSKPDLPGYVSNEFQNILAGHLNQVFISQEQQSIDIQILIADGQAIPIHLISTPVEHDPSICLVTLVDAGGKARNNKVLSHLAYYDLLTSLPNRLLFNDRLRWAIRDARRRKEKLAIMVIDLDNFKTINDTMGHDGGDLALKAVSDRMLGCLREVDTLSRMGGDEFMILMQHVADNKDVLLAAERLLEALRQPIEIMERPMVISGSIGICLYPDDGENAEHLIHNADIAMYRAKSCGRNCVAFFNESMLADVNRQSELENHLRNALKKHQLSLYYQPVVDSKTLKIIGVEALLRWGRDDKCTIPAGQFIKMAKGLGIFSSFSEWALHVSCLQMKNWIQRGLIEHHKGFRLSVNICSEQLADAELTGRISTILASCGLPASCLALEITEEAIQQDTPYVNLNLNKLRKMGILLLLDNFAQGFGSLQKISSIPFDFLKIDQVMIKLLLENPQGEALLEALLNLSHILGLKVIAEGVEDQKTSDWLHKHNCDGMQGYYFCKPLPAVQIEMLLQIPREKQK